MFKFEKLGIWKKALEFVDLVYLLTRGFPPGERFGLTSQLRRAAVSVASNIAEGASRSSKVDFARFLEIAYGSLLEAVSEAEVARRQNFLRQDDYESLYNRAEEIAMMLSGFQRKLRLSDEGTESGRRLQ